MDFRSENHTFILKSGENIQELAYDCSLALEVKKYKMKHLMIYFRLKSCLSLHNCPHLDTSALPCHATRYPLDADTGPRITSDPKITLLA